MLKKCTVAYQAIKGGVLLVRVIGISRESASEFDTIENPDRNPFNLQTSLQQ